MSPSLININDRLIKGIELINLIDLEICTKLIICIKNAIQIQKDPFSDHDLVNLEKALNFNTNEIILLLKTMRIIIENLNKMLMKPTALQEYLQESLKINQNKTDIFVQCWMENIKPLLDNMKNGESLDFTSWQLNLQIATSNIEQTDLFSNALLQFNIKNNSEQYKQLMMRLNHKDLYAFYQQLETIQNRLDEIKQMNLK